MLDGANQMFLLCDEFLDLVKCVKSMSDLVDDARAHLDGGSIASHDIEVV